MNRCICGGGGNLADVITPGQFADVIDSGGLGDVGVSVSLGQGGASASGSASLLWLAVAGLVGWLYCKR